MGAKIHRLLLAGSIVVALLATGPLPAVAGSWDEVDFEGSGWGHGVGMSQYGAYAMATMGYTYDQILAHYYKNTSIGQLDPSTALWVNLERNFSSRTLTVASVGGGAGANVSIQSEVGSAEAVVGSTIQIDTYTEVQPGSYAGCTVTVLNPGEPEVVLTDPADCSFDMTWYDWQGAATPTTKVLIESCWQTDWNATPTNSVQCQYARGMLHLRSGPGGLDLSAEMLMEDYVLGISEMPYYWTQAEALKTQAVAARTYAESRKNARGNPATNSCDGWCHVRDSTVDQRYVGWGHSNTGNWVAASQATANKVVTHPGAPNGIITAFYSSSSGGMTENAHEVGFASGPVEWLASADDSWAVDGTVWNPNAAWTKTLTSNSIATTLGWDYLTTVKIVASRTSGSAAQLEFWGILNGQAVSVTKSSTWARLTFGLKSEYFDVTFNAPGDELFFYRSSDGAFRYYDVKPDASLGAPILSGSGYSTGWSAISGVDLDGDGQDEMFFYRASDGVFRYYDVRPDATLGAPIKSGNGYSTGWSAITAVDLDGDGQDAMFFYRASDGTFRYYDINANGTLGAPIKSGNGYSTGWSAITAVDLDGDGQDEMFFYRASDGAFRYYNVNANGSLGAPIKSGTGYSTGWSSITAVDLDGDGQDEMFFYRGDGNFRYYNVNSIGSLGAPIKSGTGYSTGWSAITAVDLDGHGN